MVSVWRSWNKTRIWKKLQPLLTRRWLPHRSRPRGCDMSIRSRIVLHISVPVRADSPPPPPPPLLSHAAQIIPQTPPCLLATTQRDKAFSSRLCIVVTKPHCPVLLGWVTDNWMPSPMGHRLPASLVLLRPPFWTMWRSHGIIGNCRSGVKP